MPIVTISHEIGAGGPEIGQQLADRMGYRYVDHELISDAARRYGLLEEKLSHLDESKPSLFERFDAETRRYITVIQTALYDFAEHDNVVLMGRGGQWLLRGIPHVLRVRVMAPFDVRVKRLGKKLAGPMGEQTNPRTVTELVRRDDAEKAGRMRYLYEVGITDPALYDLVINTEKLSVAAAVGLIGGVLGQTELATTPAATQLVADRSLASRVQVALATHPETRRYRITVEARSGVVTLEGTAAMDEATDVARGVDGVRDVKVRQMDMPPIPPFVA
ncbi:MAG TPA: cytidylate kinase family protein [Methylomirabilota bacterium]|jgi:cytidylate kinase